MWPWNLMDDLEKIIVHLFYTMLRFVNNFKAIGEFQLELQSKLAIFCPAWPSNLMDDLQKQYDTSFIVCEALSILSKPSGNSKFSYSPETLNSGHKRRHLSCGNLKFDGWAWKTIGHLVCAASSFVYHFVAMGEFTVRQPPIWFNIDDFSSRVTFKSDGWPWKTRGQFS